MDSTNGQSWNVTPPSEEVYREMVTSMEAVTGKTLTVEQARTLRENFVKHWPMLSAEMAKGTPPDVKVRYIDESTGKTFVNRRQRRAAVAQARRAR